MLHECAVSAFVGDGNTPSLILVAESYGEYPDAAFAGQFRGFNRKAVMVFPVGYQDDVLVLSLLVVEHFIQCLADGVADDCAAPRDAVGRHVVEHHPEESVVKCQGTLHGRRSGKCHQGHAVALHPFKAVAYGQLCALKPGRRQVLGQHTFRDVQQEHDISSASLNGCRLRVPAGPGQCQRQQDQGRHEERGFPSAPGGTDCDPDPAKNSRLNKERHSPAPLVSRIKIESDSDWNSPQQVKHIDALETDIDHGILLKTMQRRNISRQSSTNAARANGTNFSL